MRRAAQSPPQPSSAPVYDEAPRRVHAVGRSAALGASPHLGGPATARALATTRSLAALLTLAATLLLALPAPLDAQPATVKDAGLPRHGELWIHFLHSTESWSDRFAADRTGDTIAGGTRVPLHRDFGGPLTERLFPGPGPLVQDLNLDAEALGFDPLGEPQLLLGALDFGALHAQRRRVEGSLEVGILDRVSLDVRVPVVLMDMEARFAFDPTGVTVLPGALALENPIGLFQDFAAVRADLEARIAAGELTPGEEAQALALLQESGIFFEALERRVSQNRLLPLGGTPAGLQLADRYLGLAQGFAAFDYALPGLGLRGEPTPEDVAAFFSLPALFGQAPVRVRRGWTVPEVEAGARVSLLDRYSADRPAAGPLRLRTAVGVLVRFPIGSPDELPFHDPDAFLQAPVGDAAPDVELAGYQDVALGDLLLLAASVRYGLRLSDEVTRRIHPPDRPFALVETRTRLRRDRGDYLVLRLVPQLRLNEILSLGADYEFLQLQSDSYRAVDAAPADPALLEVETGGTLHRLGFSVHFRTGRARAGDEDAAGGAPWHFTFALRGALAGSGGMRAPQQAMAGLRAPLRIF